jgi:hypothetical protein
MKLDATESESFRDWLRQNTSLSSRAINDTVSRLRRLSSLVDPLDVNSRAELEYRLQKNPEFSQLQPSVKSQLKRAATLYQQYSNLTVQQQVVKS